MNPVKNGNRVKVHFTGKMENGEVFATSHEHEPLEFQVGDGSVLPGVDKAVQGMSKGEYKTVIIPPSEGFGEQTESLIMTVDRSKFPKEFEPREGMELNISQPDGSVVFLRILQIMENQIKLDANHPLAGKTLTFELELLEVQ